MNAGIQRDPHSKLTRLKWFLFAAAGIAICATAASLITGSAVQKDAAQNVRMGVNLEHQGVVSDEPDAPYRPSMYREPLPILVDAVGIAYTDRILGAGGFGAYLDGERVRLIKLQNVFWILLLWLSVFVATHTFTKSFYLAMGAGIVAVAPFLSGTKVEGVNNLYTELPGAALLCTAAFALVVAVTDGKPWKFALAGGCFGCLVLTKASFLYVWVGVFLLLAAMYLRRRDERPKHFLQLVVLAATFLAIVLPWIGRNAHTFGEAQISERGGLAIYTRALMNEMSPTQYRGTFYIWARPQIQSFVGSILGFTAADLGLGGRLQRLNTDAGSRSYDSDLAAELAGRPQDAITFYRRARAERERLEMIFQREGMRDPDVASDRALAVKGMAMVKSAPFRDLALAVPLLWRSALLVFPIVLLGLGYALWTQSERLLLYAFPGFAYLCFYALITPFEPRPAVIARALAIVAVLPVIQRLCSSLSRGTHYRGFHS